MNTKAALLRGLLLGLILAPAVALWMFFDTASAAVGIVIYLGLTVGIIFVMRLITGGGAGGDTGQRATRRSKGAREK